MEKRDTMAYRKRLKSLTTHLRKYEKPTPNGYDLYATSYISGDIPWKKILPEEVESADLLPFTVKFEVEHYTLQGKERKLRGESVRNQDLISSAKEIFDHIKEAEGFLDREEHLGYIYFKAMQYSEVNKALALNEKYPKPDENKVRKTFSAEHQAAVAAMLEESKGSTFTGAPFTQDTRQIVHVPEIKIGSTGSRRMARTETEMEQLSEIQKVILEALIMPPMMKSSAKIMEEPWQFKVKSDHSRPKPSKKTKLKWKRNIYPPKSREERIAELRKMAPPLLPEYLETDQLPGYWRPELMVESFKTLYMETMENESAGGSRQEADDSWWRTFHVNKKCKDWLQSIPDTL